MEQPANIFKTIPCHLTMHEVCTLLDTHVEQWNDQELRIEIRGSFRDIWTKERVLLLDWHFLKSWSEHFKVMGLFALPFDEERKPWPEVRYLVYEGPGELRFRLPFPQEQKGKGSSL